MKTVFEHLRERIEGRAGLLPPQKAKYNFADLEGTEWSYTFEHLMRNRLLMGALRYGRLHAPGKPRYNRIPSMQRRLEKYATTGNLEFLVDVANLCLLEFEECCHPLKHFHAVDGENRSGVTKL